MENIARHIMRLYAIRLPSNLPLSLDELDDYLKNYESKKEKEPEVNDKDDLGQAPMMVITDDRFQRRIVLI